MIRIQLLLIVFLICSCQSNRNSSSEISIVDLDQSRTTPTVNETNSDENTYGPISYNENEQLSKSEQNPIIAIDLAPGLYSSLAYIELFDQFDRNEIEPKIIVASGFAAVIAALYVKYNNANRVNFKAFSLLSKLKNVKAHSQNWYNELDEFLNDEFKDAKQESFQKILIIPEYRNNKVEIIYSGILKNNLMNTLNLNNRSSNFLIRPSNAYDRLVKKLGVDLLFKFTTFNSTESIKTESGFLLGVYSKIKGHTNYEPHKYISLNSSISVIDKIGNNSDLLSSVRSRVSELLEAMKLKINEWKENKR